MLNNKNLGLKTTLQMIDLNTQLLEVAFIRDSEEKNSIH